MIVATVIFNTEADGTWVPEDTPEQDCPRCHYGPFASVDEAQRWMSDGYPEDDTDVREMFVEELPEPVSLVVNHPGSVMPGSGYAITGRGPELAPNGGYASEAWAVTIDGTDFIREQWYTLNSGGVEWYEAASRSRVSDPREDWTDEACEAFDQVCDEYQPHAGTVLVRLTDTQRADLAEYLSQRAEALEDLAEGDVLCGINLDPVTP